MFSLISWLIQNKINKYNEKNDKDELDEIDEFDEVDEDNGNGESDKDDKGDEADDVVDGEFGDLGNVDVADSSMVIDRHCELLETYLNKLILNQVTVLTVLLPNTELKTWTLWMYTWITMFLADLRKSPQILYFCMLHYNLL